MTVGIIYGIFVFLIVTIVGTMCFDSLLPGAIAGAIFGLVAFFACLCVDKVCERHWKQGETVTTLVQRVDWQGRTVYILTEDSTTFSEINSDYKLLTPGDTLVYQRSTKGETRILSVKYSEEEYVPKHITEEEIEEDEHGVVYMPNPTYHVYGYGSPTTPVFF